MVFFASNSYCSFKLCAIRRVTYKLFHIKLLLAVWIGLFCSVRICREDLVKTVIVEELVWNERAKKSIVNLLPVFFYPYLEIKWTLRAACPRIVQSDRHLFISAWVIYEIT